MTEFFIEGFLKEREFLNQILRDMCRDLTEGHFSGCRSMVVRKSC